MNKKASITRNIKYHSFVDSSRAKFQKKQQCCYSHRIITRYYLLHTLNTDLVHNKEITQHSLSSH